MRRTAELVSARTKLVWQSGNTHTHTRQAQARCDRHHIVCVCVRCEYNDPRAHNRPMYADDICQRRWWYIVDKAHQQASVRSPPKSINRERTWISGLATASRQLAEPICPASMADACSLYIVLRVHDERCLFDMIWIWLSTVLCMYALPLLNCCNYARTDNGLIVVINHCWLHTDALSHIEAVSLGMYTFFWVCIRICHACRFLPNWSPNMLVLKVTNCLLRFVLY